MKPTIDEQLKGTCRILQQVVAPALSDAYPQDVLRALISNLHMLSSALPRLSAFVQWDQQANAALLAGLAGQLPADSATAVQAALAQDAPDPLDWKALEARNDVLRQLLAEAIRSGTLPASDRERIRLHLVERAARNPIRYAITLPEAPAKA